MTLPKYARTLVDRLKQREARLSSSESSAKEHEGLAKIARCEASKLRPQIKETKENIRALKDKGILYCPPCDQLYAIDDVITQTKQEQHTPLPLGYLEESDVPHDWGELPKYDVTITTYSCPSCRKPMNRDTNRTLVEQDYYDAAKC